MVKDRVLVLILLIIVFVNSCAYKSNDENMPISTNIEPTINDQIDEIQADTSQESTDIKISNEELRIDKGEGYPVLPDLLRRNNIYYAEYRYTAKKNERGVFYRSRSLYNEIIEQFDVENSKRYEKEKTGETWCNIFMADVLAACEIDFFVDYSKVLIDGMDATWEMKKDKRANDLFDYFDLLENRKKCGVIQISSYKIAQKFANKGIPTFGLTNRREEGFVGHCVIVRPENEELGWVAIDGPIVAQAGRECSEFSEYTLKPEKTKYYIHIQNEPLSEELLDLLDEINVEEKELFQEIRNSTPDS